MVVRVVVEPLRDARDVAPDVRFHRGVDQRGHATFVLAVLAQHLRGDGDGGCRMLSVQDLEHPLLVPGVRVGVDEADADRVDLTGPEPPRRSHRVVVVKRPDLAPVGQPAPHRLDPIGRDDARRLHPEVAVAVTVRDRLPSDLEHVLVSLGRDEPEALDFALEQLVRRHRRAMADRADRPTVQTEPGKHLVDAGEETLRRVGGVDGVLVVASIPLLSSTATTSVNVPPVSTPIRMWRVISSTTAWRRCAVKPEPPGAAGNHCRGLTFRSQTGAPAPLAEGCHEAS